MELQSNIISYNNSLIELKLLLTEKDYSFESDRAVWEVFYDTYRHSFPEDFEAAFHMQTGVYPSTVVDNAKTIETVYSSAKSIKESSITLPQLEYSTELEKIELIQSLEPFRSHRREYERLSQTITDYCKTITLAQTLNKKAKQAGLRKDNPIVSNNSYAQYTATAKVRPLFSVGTPCTNKARHQKALARKKAAKVTRPLYFFAILLCILLPFAITVGIGVPILLSGLGIGVIVSPVLFGGSIYLSVKLGIFLRDKIDDKEFTLVQVRCLPIFAEEFDNALNNLNGENIGHVLKIITCLGNMFACVEIIHEQCNLVGSDDKKLLEMFKDLIVRGLAETTAQAAEISIEALEDKLKTERFTNALLGAVEAERQARERERERERIKNSIISANSVLKGINKNLEKLQELEEEKINKLNNLKNDLHQY